MPKANGANSIINSSVTDNATTVATTDTGGWVGPSFTANGTTAGYFQCTAGTANGHATTSTITTECPAAVTAYEVVLPGTIGTTSQVLQIGSVSPAGVANTQWAAVAGKSVLSSSARVNWGTGNTWFPGLGGYSVACSTNDIQCQAQVPVAGTISNMYVTASDPALLTGMNVTFTMFHSTTLGSAGSATTLTCSITGNGTIIGCNDTSHSFTVAAGDTISIQWSTTLGTPPSTLAIVDFLIQ
jgi:hypothetical protein